MNITEKIVYIGVDDKEIDLFEGQYDVPDGMAYNSYVILDEKIAVLDTVDKNFGGEWGEKLERALLGRAPDYLVVHHMEPDHSANIAEFAKKYPEAKIVASAKAFLMMQSFFGTDYSDRRIVVGEGDELSLGEHTLTFITAPMVHWPEVIMSYEKKEGILFSADAFGKFGALDADEDWACEARRYYFGIVGKYGAQVQAVLKKAAGLDIKKICPLHGPVLTDNLSYYISLYNTWSSYSVEEDGIVIAYTSIYGNTKAAAEKLREMLNSLGAKKVVLNDLARCDMHEAVEDAFRYSTLVLASPTYNGDVFPYMREFLAHLTERGYRNRKVALIENGSWAPTAAKVMRSAFEKSIGISFAENTVTVRSALNDSSLASLKLLAKELVISE